MDGPVEAFLRRGRRRGGGEGLVLPDEGREPRGRMDGAAGHDVGACGRPAVGSPGVGIGVGGAWMCWKL